MIEVDGITVRYNGALALSDVSLKVGPRDLFAVLGRNGAGKTTLLRTLAGIIAPSAGRVVMSGVEVRPPASFIARRGLRYVPESGNVFGELTVRDNLETAVTRLRRRESNERVDWALATFPILQPLISRKALHLSGGERQSLAVAAALMTRPRTLLLDEPSLGLSPKMASSLIASVAVAAAESEMTVVLAEQSVALAALLCGTGCWLETGRVVVSGTFGEITGALRRNVGVFEEMEKL